MEAVFSGLKHLRKFAAPESNLFQKEPVSKCTTIKLRHFFTNPLIIYACVDQINEQINKILKCLY